MRVGSSSTVPIRHTDTRSVAQRGDAEAASSHTSRVAQLQANWKPVAASSGVSPAHRDARERSEQLAATQGDEPKSSDSEYEDSDDDDGELTLAVHAAHPCPVAVMVSEALRALLDYFYCASILGIARVQVCTATGTGDAGDVVQLWTTYYDGKGTSTPGCAPARRSCTRSVTAHGAVCTRPRILLQREVGRDAVGAPRGAGI